MCIMQEIIYLIDKYFIDLLRILARFKNLALHLIYYIYKTIYQHRYHVDI